ncbi:hypothetical protein P3T22_006640 [Paraburkholderia sp. GAS348]
MLLMIENQHGHFWSLAVTSKAFVYGGFREICTSGH